MVMFFFKYFCLEFEKIPWLHVSFSKYWLIFCNLPGQPFAMRLMFYVLAGLGDVRNPVSSLPDIPDESQWCFFCNSLHTDSYGEIIYPSVDEVSRFWLPWLGNPYAISWKDASGLKGKRKEGWTRGCREIFMACHLRHWHHSFLF